MSTIHPIHNAIWKNDLNSFVDFLTKGICGINTKDANGLRSLDIAIITNNAKMVEYLLNYKADEEIEVDITVWRYVALLQNETITRELLKKHSNSAKHSISLQRETLFHYAVLYRSSSLVQQCISLNMNVNDATINGYTPLHFAAMINESNIVDTLLRLKTTHVNLKTVDGRSPLHLAVKHRSIESLILLLNSEIDVNDSVGTSGLSAVHIAVENNDFSTMNILLEYHANINCKDLENRTLLHVAAEFGHENMTKFLLRKGLNIDALTSGDSTPLDTALKNKNYGVVAILLQNNANIHITNHEGLSPLFLAIKHRHFDLVEKLVMKGANVHEIIAENHSTLQFALKYQQDEIIKFLLLKKVNIHFKDTCGKNMLHFAAEYCDENIVKLLITKDMNVNETSDDESTALHCAIENEKHCSEVVTTLLNYGANVDALNMHNETPLYLALISKRNIPACVVDELLINGADPNYQDRNGVSLLEWAIKREHENGRKFEEILVRFGANVNKLNINDDNALHVVFKCKRYHPYKIDLYLKKGVNVNGRNSHGETPLKFCLGTRNNMCHLKNLAKYGVSLKEVNEFGESVLHQILRNGHSITARMLIETRKDIDLKAVTKSGSTLLHYAVQYHAGKKFIEYLLDQYKGNINTKDKSGQTPLHLTTYRQYPYISDKEPQRDVANLLLRHGADINIKDDNDDSVLSLAISNGHGNMVELLLKNGACLTDKHRNGHGVYHIAARGCNRRIFELLQQYRT